MSALGVSQFASLPLESRVPQSLAVAGKGVNVQEIVLSRKSMELVPIGKSTGLNPLEQIDLRISAANEFLIPSSLVLEFDLFNTSTDAGGVASLSCGFDDLPAASIFDRADIFLGGSICERIEDLGSTTTARVYAHSSRDYYSHNLKNMCEAWKHNTQDSGNYQVSLANLPTLSGGDATGITDQTINNYIQNLQLALSAGVSYTSGVNARQQLATAQVARTAVPYVAGTTAGVPAITAGRHYTETQGPIRCQLPLGLVCGFASSLQAFPLAFVSDVRFLFTLNQAVKCMISTSATDIPNFRVDNVRLHADYVEVSQDYIKAMAQILSSGDETMGYHLPIHTLTTRKASLGTLTNGVDTKIQSVFTIATPFLDSVLTWQRLSNVLVSTYNTSAMPCWFKDFGLSRTTADIQLVIGSTRYPNSQPLDNAVELYAYNVKEEGQVIDVEGTASVNTFASLTEQASSGGICFLYQNFHSLIGMESQAEGFEFESYDTNQYAGQIQFQSTYNVNGTGSYEQVMVGQHTKVFSLSSGVAKIMG
jgi:hypothetical protein